MTSFLLGVASWWCGRRVTALVFEPLLADWQHQLDSARTRARYVAAFASGAFAFTRSLARCSITAGGWLPTSRAVQIVGLTFFVAFDAAMFLLWMATVPFGRMTDLSSMQARAFLLSAAPLAFAPILLPALFLMRRDARSTARHAVSVIAVGALLTAGVVWLRSPENFDRYFSTFEMYEGEYQRHLANDRAGRVTYPATAVRQLRPTTLEQRRANYEHYMAWRAQQEAKLRPSVTWREQLTRYQPVGLAVLFGVMGWTLAGLGSVSFKRATGWWFLIYAAMLAFGGVPGTITGLAMPILPQSYAIPIFGAAALALVVASWRPRDEGPM